MIALPWVEGMLAEADYPTVVGKGLRVDTSGKSMYLPLAAAQFSLSSGVELLATRDWSSEVGGDGWAIALMLL